MTGSEVRGAKGCHGPSNDSSAVRLAACLALACTLAPLALLRRRPSRLLLPPRPEPTSWLPRCLVAATFAP